MIELYITQSRTYYPENNGGVEVVLYGRTPEGDAEMIRVQGFDPYFYVPESEADLIQPKEHSGLDHVEKDCDTPSLFGDNMAKIVATYPGAIRKLSDQYENTFEADVEFTARFRVDHQVYTGVKAPSNIVNQSDIEAADVEADPRYCYYDIEIDDRGSMPVQGDEIIHTDSEIVTICAYDSYLEEHHGFISLGERHPTDVIPEVMETGEAPGCIDKLHFSYNEKDMLKDWFAFVGETNPDLLLAWNNLGFDAPYLIERSSSIGLDPSSMSRKPEPEVSAGQYDPEISGRVVYDLMKAWKRMQYSDVSAALDNAASMEMGDDAGKIEHEESIYELWQNNASKLLRYNGRDVSLMVDIDETAGIMEDREELKDTVGVDYEQTYEANDFIEMLARRKLEEWGVVGPTKSAPKGGNGDDDDYEGAYTFPAFGGRRKNVTSIDLASLYPFTMKMLNSSPETLVGVFDDPQDYIQENGDQFELSAAPNGAVFRQNEDGLFRELVDEALELTQQAGRRRDKHDAGSAEWEYWNQTREARKRIRNGLYGVLGWVWFFLYDEPVAESVTTMAQVVIKESAEYINDNTEGNVIYGDTDSCYISWPDEWTITECLESTDELVNTLNGDVYPALAEEWGMPAEECKWEIEIEDASAVMFQSNKKKRYSKRVVWKEGMEYDARLNDDKYSIKGYECVRSDTAPLLDELQRDVLKMIVDEAPASEIRDKVFQATQEIQRRDADLDLIGIPGGIGKALDSYDSDTAQVSGSKVANRLFDLGIGQGDKPKRVYLEPKTIQYNDVNEKTEVICFDDSSDIEGVENQLYVDVSRMREVIIKKPMSRILDSLDIDAAAAMKGKKQNSIADYV